MDIKKRALVKTQTNKNLQFEFSLSLIEIISIVGALQLALRHPKYTGPSASLVRNFINTIMVHFGGLPALQKAIKSWDDPYLDWKPRKKAKP